MTLILRRRSLNCPSNGKNGGISGNGVPTLLGTGFLLTNDTVAPLRSKQGKFKKAVTIPRGGGGQAVRESKRTSHARLRLLGQPKEKEVARHPLGKKKSPTIQEIGRTSLVPRSQPIRQDDGPSRKKVKGLIRGE